MTPDFVENSYLYGANSTFIEELYQRYLVDAGSVDASWQKFFGSLGDAASQPVSWDQFHGGVIGQPDPDAPVAKPTDKKDAGKGSATAAADVSAAQMTEEAMYAIRALQLIRAYRVRGHLLATLDPLGIERPKMIADLMPETYGFTTADEHRSLYFGGNFGLERATLKEVLSILRETYCGTFAVEYMHIQDLAQRDWVQTRMEKVRGRPKFSNEEKKGLLRTLLEVEGFEEFVQVKYTGMKRFSVQGGDAMVPGLLAILETASDVGVDEIVIGMPHRGRMNVLTTIMGKPYSELLSIFKRQP